MLRKALFIFSLALVLAPPLAHGENGWAWGGDNPRRVGPDNTEECIAAIARAGFPGGEDAIATLRATQRAASHANSHGGATFDLDSNKELTGKPYFAVSIYPERTKKVRGRPLHRDDVHDFMIINRDILAQPNHSIGVWKNLQEGTTELDIVVTIPKNGPNAARVAHDLASEYNQIAYFDLENKRVTFVPGATGFTPPGLPPAPVRYERVRTLVEQPALR